MTNPIVSIIVLTYNQKNTIARTLNSIIDQKFDLDIEILVGEDCSSDGTRAVVDHFASTRPDIVRKIYSPYNVGAQRNLINCLRAARGQFIAFCEGDDFWVDPNKLMRQVLDLKNNPNCDLAFSRGWKVYEDGSRELGWDYGPSKRIISPDELFGHYSWVAPSASLIWRRHSTSSIERLINDAGFADLVIILLGSARGGAIYDPEPTVAYQVMSPASFSVKLNLSGREKRRSFYFSAAQTIRETCETAGLPLSVVKKRLDDYHLMIARLYWQDRMPFRAMMSLMNSSMNFLLHGALAKAKRILKTIR